jgi:hypothetical protein
MTPHVFRKPFSAWASLLVTYLTGLCFIVGGFGEGHIGAIVAGGLIILVGVYYTVALIRAKQKDATLSRSKRE